MAMDEDATADFIEIGELQKFGVNVADISKLKAGYVLRCVCGCAAAARDTP